MKNHFGRFLLVFVIVGLCAWSWAQKGIRQGLDLAGGASLTYVVKSEHMDDLDRERMQRVIEVLDKRLNSLGLSEITITPTTQNEVVVELPGRGAEQIKDIKRIVERNGELEFRIRAETTRENQEREKRAAAGGAGSQYYTEPTDMRWVPVASEEVRGGIDEILVEVPDKPFQAKLRAAEKRSGVDSADYRDAHAELEKVQRREYFTGNQLIRTEVTYQGIQRVVSFEFEDERKPYFHEFTKRNVDRPMAIILDGKVASWPVIEEPLDGQGIIRGGGTGFKEHEARELAIVLESGSTGVQLQLSREEIMGPSLGQDAIERGQLSIAIGLLVVLAVMVFYYRLPGLVADLALILNLVILMGVLAFFRAALSLPGIAGIVLTLGMAVDANVLIFERFRDERQRGKSVAEALAAGYDRAMSAIIDGNATTILTALVLIAMGSGAVKGFGISLTIGLVASMFTAIFVTRWVFEWALDRGILKQLNVGRDKVLPRIDYMRWRAWFTGPSIALMIMGVIVYVMRDDAEKRDLEFVGGQQATIQLAKAIPADEARRRAQGTEWPEAAPVALGAEGVDEPPKGSTNRYLVRVKARDTKEGDRFIEHLEKAFADLMVPPAFSDVSVESAKEGHARASFVLHTIGAAPEPAVLETALSGAQVEGAAAFKDVRAEKVEGDASAVRVSLVTAAAQPTQEGVRTVAGDALKDAETPVMLSDPMPSKSFLEPSRAQELYQQAIEAVLVALLFQVLYIRLRFADFKHGFAAVVALLHDVVVSLGFLSLFDQLGWIYAKINLVVIASFLTLMGYSMNDTIVVFDRIRENLGKSRTILSKLVNDSINQTLVRTIRTGLTVWLVVMIQFFLNRGTGSVLEGFAFVMLVGGIVGTYSSIFIAAPLLLFLPGYFRVLAARPKLTAVQVVAMLGGMVTAMVAEGFGWQLWIGTALGSNLAVHFLVYFIPWLRHPDPDKLLHEEVEAEALERPVASPGI